MDHTLTFKANLAPGISLLITGEWYTGESQTWDHPGSPDEFVVTSADLVSGSLIDLIAELDELTCQSQDGTRLRHIGLQEAFDAWAFQMAKAELESAATDAAILRAEEAQWAAQLDQDAELVRVLNSWENSDDR